MSAATNTKGKIAGEKMSGGKASARAAAQTKVTADPDALVQPTQPEMTPMGSSPAGNRARLWNRWRERYNPLRSLNISRAVTLLEQYQRGEMADPQWVYFFVEQSDSDLFAILERREAALSQLDWNIKLMSGRWPKDDPRQKKFDQSLAAEQAAALREAYEGIDNLEDAITHLQLASFRGYSHCEKYRNADGDIYHLELVDQWNMVRDLLRGEWKYNPEALSTTFYQLPEANLVDRADFLIRERDRHVNRIALVKYIRGNLSEKDWDAFVEIYGLPSGVIVGPPGVPPEKEQEFRKAAQEISEGGGGYLPNGSTYEPNDHPRSVTPFRPRLDYLTEKLVLAGTGGLLTMLAQSGSGTLAGSAHQEAFDSIARAEAKKISAIFNRSLDAEVLEASFPGQPRLVYFEIAANDELDPSEIGKQAKDLRMAGYRIDADQLSEKTGYTLFDAAEPAKVDLRETTDAEDPDTLAEQLQQKATDAKENGASAATAATRIIQHAVKQLGPEKLGNVKPITNRLRTLLSADDAEFPARFMSLAADLPALCQAATADPASGRILAATLSAALLSPASK